MIVNTRPAGGEIPFGLALTYDENKDVVVFGSATTNTFVGVAGKEIKSALTYLDQNVGKYAKDEPVSVFMRGSINVKCQRSTPRLAALCTFAPPPMIATPAVWWAALRPRRIVGRPRCWGDVQWGGPADANGSRSL